MSVTWNGRMIVAMRITNRMFLPGKRNRANPYATRADDSTAPIVLRTATAAVLKSSLGKLRSVQTWAKFPRCTSKTHACSSVRQEPCQTIGVWVASVGSMNVLSLRPFLTSIRFRVTPSMGTA